MPRRPPRPSLFPYTDALPISQLRVEAVPESLAAGCAISGNLVGGYGLFPGQQWTHLRSEEHTSELQSRGHLVCRPTLEKRTVLLKMSSSTPTRSTALQT